MSIFRNKLTIGALLLAAMGTAPVAAQLEQTAHGARSGAMGGVFLPPAEQTRAVQLDYRHGYLATGMADKRLRVAWPIGIGSVTASYTHHGNLDWHEQGAAAGYLLRATSWMRVGVEAQYLHLGTSDGHYQPQQWLGATAMILAEPGRNTGLNLLAGTRPWDKKHPYRIHLQATYRPLPQLLTVVEAEREERTRLRMGLEYLYEQVCYVRTGFSTAPVTFTFGLGTRQRHYSIDLAVEVHSSLGITPQTSLALWF